MGWQIVPHKDWYRIIDGEDIVAGEMTLETAEMIVGLHKAGWDAAIDASGEAAIDCFKFYRALGNLEVKRAMIGLSQAIYSLPYKPQEDISDG